MNHRSVGDLVIETLREMPCAVEGESIAMGIKPIGDLGLDSEDEIEFICRMEAKLDLRLDPKDRVLVHESGKRARTVGEVISYLQGIAAAHVEQG